MIVRALDINGDWTFGAGKNNYLVDINCVAQMIQTRILMFLNDCFFALDQGIDWFNLLGSKNQIGLNLAISATLLNTPGITAINQLSIGLDTSRVLSVVYNANSVYGNISNTVSYSFI